MPDEILLNYLGQAYFHQDFDLEADTPTDLVQRFATEEYPDYVEILVRELSGIMAGSPTEEDARRLWMDDARSSYDPAVDGVLYVDWLYDVLSICERELRARAASESEED